MEDRYKEHSLPAWMKIDARPLDKGGWQKWGYGYTRRVNKRELWRCATRYFKRRDGHFNAYKEVKLMPGAYFVSDHGRIYSIYSGLISTSRKHKRKETLILDAEGRRINVRPYKLVLDNWIEPPEYNRNVVRHLLDSVNHIDGRPWNDKLNNLQYTTRSINAEHARIVLQKGGRKRKIYP